MNKFCAGIHTLIKKNCKYLLIKRSDKDKDDPGCWDLPGGGIDWGEQPDKAAVREAKEEAGLDIKVNKILSVRGEKYDDNWSTEIIAEGLYLSGDVQLSPEHCEFRWVTEQELLEIQPKGEHLLVLADLLGNKEGVA